MHKEQKLIYDIINKIAENDSMPIKHSQKIDWQVLLDLSIFQKVFPLVVQRVTPPGAYRFLYTAKFNLHKSMVANAIHQTATIQRALHFDNCRFAIVKGFVLSQTIYEIAYARQFCDIDILVNEHDMLTACRTLETTGYTTPAFGCLDDFNVSYHPFYKDLYYTDANGISFINTNSSSRSNIETFMVEVHKSGHGYSTGESTAALKRREQIKVDNNMFYTLSLPDMFIHMLENCYFDNCTPLGKQANIGHIVDMFTFIVKHHSMFTKAYLSLISQSSHYSHLGSVVRLLKDFFSADNFLQLPRILQDLTGGFSSGINGYVKILSSEEHILAYQNNRREHAINCKNGNKTTVARNITSPPFDIEKGLLSTNDIMFHGTMINALNVPPLHHDTHFDNSYLYMSSRIPSEYPQLTFTYTFANTDEYEGYDRSPFTIVEYCFDKNSKPMTSSKINNLEILSTAFTNYTVVTLKMPRLDCLKHTINNEPCLYFCIRVRHSSSYIVADYGSEINMVRVTLDDKY